MSRIDVGDRVSWVAAGEGAIWVRRLLGNRGAGDIVEINPATGKIVGDPRRLKGSAGGLAAGEGGVWVVTGPFDQNRSTVFSSGDVLRLDPVTRKVVARIRVPSGATWGLAVGEGAVWAANASGGVSRIDPATNRVVATIPIGNDAESIRTGAGFVWVVDEKGRLHRIDPSTNRVTGRAELGLEAVASDAVWVTGPWAPNGALRRLDPQTLQPEGPILPFDILPASVAIAGRQVWVGKDFFYCERQDSEGYPIVSFAWFRVDPATLEPLSGPVFVGDAGSAVFTHGDLWIDDDIGNAVIRMNLSVADQVLPVPTPGLPSPAPPDRD